MFTKEAHEGLKRSPDIESPVLSKKRWTDISSADISSQIKFCIGGHFILTGGQFIPIFFAVRTFHPKYFYRVDNSSQLFLQGEHFILNIFAGRTFHPSQYCKGGHFILNLFTGRTFQLDLINY